ncbi:hypothetical protein KUTeg_012359 [Tegillarca granosa]|uniref:Uncharacterized protein n=1 Tax=Tegillarca granosa TaxID=220873 RepID=A0ABQ9EZA1_TEGGR|nr:hypothetical protein KUTeg_012359 [Tegillarca granosa]
MYVYSLFFVFQMMILLIYIKILTMIKRGMPEEYEDKMEQERRPVESDTDMLLLDTLPQEHEKSFEMHPANEPVFEPVLTSALLSSNQVKPQEMHCIDFSECNPDTQTEQNENLIKRAEIRNSIEYGTDVLLLEPLPQEQQKSLEMYPAIVPVFKQVLMPTPLSCKQVKPQEEHCTEVSESNPDTQMEENKSVMKMTETRNSKDCEKSIAEFFCPQCLNAKAVFGIALCQPCSDALHKGATRRHHVLEDIKNTNKKLTLVDTIEDEKFSCEEDEDEYVPSKESEDEASDKNDDEIDVMEGQNIIEDSSDAESVEIPIQTVKSNEIKIQQPVKTENAKRANKYHSCPFCDNLFFKLPRHLEQKHFIEAEVRKALAFPKKSKERRKALLAIQNLGDYNHNCRVLLKGSGVVIPKYITKKGKQKFEKTNYIPCEFCLALYKKKELWKHHMHCPKRPADEKLKARKNPVSAGRMLLPSKSGSAEFNRDILNNMKKEDEVKEIIVSDIVIICFGERLYELHGHNQHHLNYISNRLRELGRLMVCVRSNDGNVSSVEEILNPHNFDLLIRSVKQIAGYSAEDGIYQIPSLPLRLGQSLEKCANILKCKAIENGLKDVIEKMDSFLALYDLDWTTRISSRAHATLNLGKFNRPQMLPLVEDVVQLHKYLDSRLLEVSKQDLSFREQYLRYCEIILAQVILFNRKRSGEAQRIRLKDFKVVEEETVDEQIVESLTPFERELCKSHKRVEIIGKKGGKVPVIFTNKMVMNIDKILQLRKELDIPNDFLFGRPDSKFPFRGCDCIRKFANQCGAKKPDLITSTQLRKQLATMCQVLGLTENNQDILAKFMGHDIRVHRDYYRLPDSVYQLGKVTKILHAINSGSVSEFAGKNFEDIEFSSKDTFTDESLDEIDSYESEENDEEIAEESNIEKTSGKSSNKVSTKATPWSKEEIRAVERRLGKFLQLKKIPGKKDCEEAKLKETALNNRSWQKIKHYIRNRNSKLSSVF